MTRWRPGRDQQALTTSCTKPRGWKSTDKASADPRTPLYPKAEGLGRRSSRRNSRHTRNGSGIVGMVGADSLSQPPGAIRPLSPGVIRPLSRHSVILGRISSWGNMVSRDDYTDHGYQSVVSFLGLLLLIRLHCGYQRAPCAQIKGRSRGLDLRGARKSWEVYDP